MQRSALLLTFFFIFCKTNAQYYYNDVVSLKSSNSIYSNLISNNVHEVTATNVQSDNTPSEDFAYSKLIKNNGAVVLTHTELETGSISNRYDTYANGLLVQSQDSTDNVRTTVLYNYDNKGNIVTIQTTTDDTAMSTHSTELHKWFYTADIPDSMIRVKDNTDSTIIHFKKDEQQHIAEEIWLKKNREIEHYYYYYNDAGMLTDIVRFNTKAQQLLPDFLFEYDEQGMISQLTQVLEGSSDYIIWQYVYNDKRLKTKDVLFNKQHELLGTVTYQYR